MTDQPHMVYKQLEDVRLLPLYTATDVGCLESLEEILVNNQLPLVEVTFRSSLASQAIKKLANSGRLSVGAGTVRNLEEAKIAIASGAKYVVSPAVVPEVIEYCLSQGIPVFPGTATPSDIQRALTYGLKVVKFFPADIYGGIEAIKALSGPFYDVMFLPTGGIHQGNIQTYLDHPQVVAVGGSFIISEAGIKKNAVAADLALKQLMQSIEKSKKV